MRSKKKIGLALGGGGARGFAHLGVLRALDDAGIIPDVYSGASMGAIIAVANLQRRSFNSAEKELKRFVIQYAKHFDLIEFTESQEYQDKSIFQKVGDILSVGSKFIQLASKHNRYDGKILEEIAAHFIYPCNLEDLSKKIYVAAVDVVSGQLVLMNQGNACHAVRASMSIAGAFPPVPLRRRMLIDASAVFPIPIHAFKFEPIDFIIACDVGININPDYNPASGFDMLLRQFDMLYGHVVSEVKHCSDYVIHPFLEDIHWTDFSKLEVALERGYNAGKKAAPFIIELLESKKPTIPIPHRPWHDSGYAITPVVIDNFPTNQI